MEIKETFDFYDRAYLKSYNLNESIKYQLNILDSLDAFTRKHCENVATITCNLCKKLHCSKGFTEYCVTCAYLHDIGKSFIPQSILQKPGKLTDEEFEIMKTHTTIGYNMCMKDSKLKPFYAGPYYHHEALNGTGYPQGLTKKQIPYEAQIIRVADEYDALVSKRQYKSHIGISDAFKIIIENTTPSDALKILIENTKPDNDSQKNSEIAKLGKNNKIIVKKLRDVIIDDIEYEISCVMNYSDSLAKELNRYKKIESYINKKDSATKENDKIYYDEIIKSLLKPNESIDKFFDIHKELKEAYDLRQKKINDLYKEIKIIKKLKI